MHAPGQRSQALPGIQPSLHLISLVNTQLTVTLAHLSPPAHLDLKCCSSFLSVPLLYIYSYLIVIVQKIAILRNAICLYNSP